MIDIGRKERTSWHSEVSLGIGTTLDSFQFDGNLPVLMERLKREDMDGETDSEKVRSIQAVIPSGPVAVPHFTIPKQCLSLWNRTITGRQVLVKGGFTWNLRGFCCRWYKCWTKALLGTNVIPTLHRIVLDRKVHRWVWAYIGVNHFSPWIYCQSADKAVIGK